MIAKAAVIIFSACWTVAPLAAAPMNVTSGPQVIVTLLIDDLGYYDTSVWNPAAPTPTIGALADEGLRLDRQYTYWYCSPTRRSFLSGRFPAHIGGGQADICSNILSLNFTLLSDKLKQAKFNCHMIGKGHLGYETEDHLPTNVRCDGGASGIIVISLGYQCHYVVVTTLQNLAACESLQHF